MSNKKLPKEYSVYAKETIDEIYTMLKTKSKEDIKDRALKSLHNALIHKSENARLLLSDENFLKVCKEELDLVPNDEIIFLDDLLKGYEEKIKVFIVESNEHDNFIVAHNIAEINNAIFSMHDGITPDSQNEEFGISISLKELPKSEYEELISKEWEA